MSLAKQNYATVTEETVNEQINNELQASHSYMAMSSYFGRDSVAVPGLEKFFAHASKEEREHAEKLIKYQNMRGGKVVMRALEAPESEWTSARNALETALQMERDINVKLLKLHQIASEQNDVQLCDFVESEFLQEQVESIKQISDLLTQLARVGNDGLGLYLFDRDLSA